MPDLSTCDLESLFTMLIGTPGTRKSTNALSWPLPQFWLSWDQKMNALALPAQHWGLDTTQIHYEDFTDFNQAKRTLEGLLLHCPYRTIIADSLTTAANATLRQSLQLKTGSTRSGAAQGRRVAGIAVNEMEDYLAESSALLELVALLKDLQKSHHVHVVLIAHLIAAEYKSPNQQTNVVRTIVTAGKRVAPMIPAYCEEVYHHFIKKGLDADRGGDYAILTSSTSDDFARTLLPLPSEILVNDRPLYPTTIAPAITHLKESITPCPSSPSTTPTSFDANWSPPAGTAC